MSNAVSVDIFVATVRTREFAPLVLPELVVDLVLGCIFVVPRVPSLEEFFDIFEDFVFVELPGFSIVPRRHSHYHVNEGEQLPPEGIAVSADATSALELFI